MQQRVIGNNGILVWKGGSAGQGCVPGIAGKRELARELANKSREHEQLAAEARVRANETAFDGHNRSLLNRWKARLPHSLNPPSCTPLTHSACPLPSVSRCHLALLPVSCVRHQCVGKCVGRECWLACGDQTGA